VSTKNPSPDPGPKAPKAATAAQIVAGLRKSQTARKLSPTSVLVGDGAGAGVKRVCPTGFPTLDRWVLGIGGLAYGRVIEMFGPESAGKDTLMDCFMAGAQRDGAQVALIDTEHKWDPKWAQLHGVDTENVIWDQPACLEDALATAETLVEKSTQERPIFIAFNSIAGCPSRKEITEGITGDAGVAEQARVWSRFGRIIVAPLSRNQALFLGVNQIRALIGNMYGPKETTPGGAAIKFYSYLRLAVGHGKMDPDKSRRLMSVRAMKNQSCPPMRATDLKLDFATGFVKKFEILNYAKEMGCVDAKCQSLKEALKALDWEDLATQVKDDEETAE
jgi:recombination protein RecA